MNIIYKAAAFEQPQRSQEIKTSHLSQVQRKMSSKYTLHGDATEKSLS